MQYKFLPTLVALLLTTVCFSQPKGKLFIIGGGSRPDAMIARLIKESGIDKGGYGIVLPMSSATQDSSVYYANEKFIAQGFTLKGVFFTKPAQVNKQKTDSVRNAKLIYITGGDQVRFMGIVGGTPVEAAILEAYRNGATIAGTSAGAAVMSKIMITGNQLKHPDYESTFSSIEEKNLETSRGLGLLENVIVDQHFLARSRHNRLITAVIEFDNVMGVGIDESTAILVVGKDAEVIGDAQVIVLTNPTQSRRSVNGILGAKDLRMTVYLPGDHFALPK
ncbi:MAG TPA: cyanophycinase [Cyclobacteriaceae bacterium]|nr:cyanophycinase [Cyclobacteriaceae bacterium]